MKPSEPAAVARFLPQPTVGWIISLLASVALGGSWLRSGPDGIGPGELLLAGLLACSIAAAYQFPIHIERCQKVEMVAVSLYLMAVLLPAAALASTGAGLGILAGEMLVRAKRGNYYSDVATATCRWTIVTLAGSTFCHLYGSHSAISLVGTAAILWAGDVLTNLLVIAPMTGERPLLLMLSNARAAALPEG